MLSQKITFNMAHLYTFMFNYEHYDFSVIDILTQLLTEY